MRFAAIAVALVAALACQPSEAGVPDGTGERVVRPDDESPRARRVWSDAQDYASPSPDGRLVAFVDWTTGDVAVHDLKSGESRRVTDKGGWEEDGSWGEFPIFSPDGKKVVYAYGNAKDGDGFRYELRYVELGSTEQHVLRSLPPTSDWIAPSDWHPRRGLLFTEYPAEDSSFLALMDPETKAVREVAHFSGATAREAVLSPDGRYVAYWIRGAVRVLDLDRGSTESLGLATGALVDWTADGRGLVVQGTFEGQAGLHQVALKDGRRVGDPRLIRGGVPSIIPGGGRAGDAFYYSIAVDAPRVYLASVDPDAGRLLSQPVPQTSPVDGQALLTRWSPDGRSLAYGLRALNGQGPTRLLIARSDGDEVRELATVAGRISSLEWAPDGGSLYVLTRRSQGTLLRVSVRDGTVDQLRDGMGDYFLMDPTGRSVLVSRASDAHGTEPGIFRVDLETGAERKVTSVYEDRRARDMTLSPDGRMLAWIERSAPNNARTAVRLIPIDGGQARTLGELESPVHFDPNYNGFPWTPDGRFLLVSRGEWENEGSHDLWSLSVETGETKPLGLPNHPGNNGWFSLHPDGKRLAYTSGQVRKELWVVDRLD